jgi:hypothetical protein
MKSRKSAGPDGLNSEISKYGGPDLSHRLSKLIYKSWRERWIPEEWGHTRVKCLFKKGTRVSCSNYRDISLLKSGYKMQAQLIT